MSTWAWVGLAFGAGWVGCLATTYWLFEEIAVRAAIRAFDTACARACANTESAQQTTPNVEGRLGEGPDA